MTLVIKIETHYTYDQNMWLLGSHYIDIGYLISCDCRPQGISHIDIPCGLQPQLIKYPLQYNVTPGVTCSDHMYNVSQFLYNFRFITIASTRFQLPWLFLKIRWCLTPESNHVSWHMSMCQGFWTQHDWNVTCRDLIGKVLNTNTLTFIFQLVLRLGFLNS